MKVLTSHTIERKDFKAWEFEAKGGTVYTVKPAPIGSESNWEVKADGGRYLFATKKEARKQLQKIDEKMKYWTYKTL